MKIYYSLSSTLILTDSDINKKLWVLKQAGVTNINLLGYFWGHFESPLEQIVQARDILKNEGFEVGIISVGVGHPGNSLDPSNPNLSLQIPSHWRYRINKKGFPVYYCADIEANMIKDNADAVHQFIQHGFTEIIFDDDCRLGNWGSEIQGCFCPKCLEEFNLMYNHHENLISLSKAIQQRQNHALLSDWVTFNCNKLLRFFEPIQRENIKMGLMVMARGDERHGIDIKSLRQHFPRMRFRVGEEHFCDRHFESPRDKVNELLGMMAHLNSMDPALTFSETTVFPLGQLSPDNLVYKAKMALILGIPNIYLMNGLGFLPEPYWNAFIQKKDQLHSLAAACLTELPTYPIHLMNGTHGALGETIINSPLAFLAGLPVKPVRADDVGEGADILFILGKYQITSEWEKKLSKYQLIIFDREAHRYNKHKLPIISKISSKVLPFSFFDRFKPHSRDNEMQISFIRKIIAVRNPSYPYLQCGKNIGIIWRKKHKNLILINFERNQNRCELVFEEKINAILLNPLEFRIESL